MICPSSDILFNVPYPPTRETLVCRCHDVTAGQLLDALKDGVRTRTELQARTAAGTQCGSCIAQLDLFFDGDRSAADPTRTVDNGEQDTPMSLPPPAKSAELQDSNLPPRQSDRPKLALEPALWVGLGLLLLYLVQMAVALAPSQLIALQREELWRRWSGAAVLCVLVCQWLLPTLRNQSSGMTARRALSLHRWVGALSPLVLFVHTTRPGFGLLAALGWIFLANVGLGLVDRSVLGHIPGLRPLVRAWLPIHVLLSCLLSVLAGLHLVRVFAYKGALLDG